MRNYKKELEHLTRTMKELENEIPETMVAFTKMQRNHAMNGALSAKNKALVALGISISTSCQECITTQLHHVLNYGASREEILEVISVSIMMGGGHVLAYAGQALEALRQFEDQTQPARLYDHVSPI